MCPRVCAGAIVGGQARRSSRTTRGAGSLAPRRARARRVTRIAASPSLRRMQSSVNAGSAGKLMTEGAIIQLPQWLRSPVGQVLLEWEQRHLDSAVADLFGFHALQFGLPQLDALRANRMPHRWLAVESACGWCAAHRAAASRTATREIRKDLRRRCRDGDRK